MSNKKRFCQLVSLLVVRFICFVSLLLSSMIQAQTADENDWAAPLAHARQLLQQQDYLPALQAFKQHANSGNGLAEFNVALFYQLGWGVTPDRSLACHWFEKSAKNNMPYAQQAYADCLLAGQWPEWDKSLALHWYEKAFQSGIVGAACSAGEMHLKGEVIAKSIDKGLQLCKLAAEKGDINALANLGKWYFKGQYVAQNIELAFSLLQSAAQKGHVESAYFVALYYDSDLGGKQDLIKARQWYEKSAVKGHHQAYLPLSALYWQAFIDAPSAEKEALLAKAYLWGKAAQLSPQKIPNESLKATLLTKIFTETPISWQATLDEKVASHFEAISSIN